MKIMILAHALRAGGGRATCTNILNALHKIDKENTYHIIVPDQLEYRRLHLESKHFTVDYYQRRFGHIGRRVFDSIVLPPKVNSYNPDVLWAMGGLGMQAPPCPQVVSIQNPYVMYPSEHWGRLPYIDRLWSGAVRKAFRKQLPNTQRVICQTATMEKRLRETYGYKGGTLVTGKAVSAFATEWDGNIPEALQLYGAKYKMLYVTRYYPHKGLEILLATMDRFRDELGNIVCFVTIEGEQHPYAARFLKAIRKKGLEDRIVNIGRLAQKDLSAWYRNCDALVMPTLLESFSASYLEAMHFGLPILTSDLDFAHEVCGDAALYFDPWDVATLRDAIIKFQSSPEVAQSLRTKGLLRLRGMDKTWEQIAQKILGDIRTVARCS